MELSFRTVDLTTKNMGCALASRQANETESILREAEVYSGFRNLKVKTVDFELRKQFFYDHTSPSKLLSFMQTLGLAGTAQQLEMFPSRKESNCLNLEPVLVTFLLLAGAQTQEEKMERLYEVFDPTTQGFLTVSSLRKLLKTMFLAATMYAPQLTLDLKKKKANQGIEAYLRLLYWKVEPVAATLAQSMMRDRTKLTLQEFLAEVKKNKSNDLSRCSGIRELLQRARLRSKNSSYKKQP